MKKKTIGKILMLLVTLVLVFGFTSCEWLLEVLVAPVGYVYDAKTGEPLSGVTVQLNRTNGTTAYTTSTNTNGYYTFTEGAEYGTFELTATKTGYLFTEQIVEVTGIAQTLPLIGGFDPGDEVFSIVVFWDEGFADVDAYLTMPNGYKDEGTIDSANFYESSAATTTGFFPTPAFGAADDRLSVHNSSTTVYDPTDSTTLVAELDIDNVGGSSDIPGGPETISVYTFPFYTSPPSPTYTPVEADRSGLPLNNNYVWVGTMEYWLDAWTDVNENKTSDTYGADDPDALLASADFTVNAANPVVYIFDSTGQKGFFTLPNYMDIETASILRINLFYDITNSYTEYFQFLPDIKAYASYESIDRSLTDVEPIVIKGRSRS